MTVKKWAERALGGLMESEAGEWVHEADYDALAARLKEHEQFRHQHRDCDAMGVENQHLRARLAEAEARVDEQRNEILGLHAEANKLLDERDDALKRMAEAEAALTALVPMPEAREYFAKYAPDSATHRENEHELQ